MFICLVACIYKFVSTAGFERLSSRLNNLQVLDLSYNFFNESLLSSLTGFSSLKSLNLGYNQFTTPIQPQGKHSYLFHNLFAKMLENEVFYFIEGNLLGTVYAMFLFDEHRPPLRVLDLAR